MQSVSTAYTDRVNSPIRHIDSRVLISFLKQFDNNIDFFTIGTSTIGGTDIIKGNGSVVQEWDKYDYEDFSNRVKSIEWVREADPPLGAVTLAMADIVLDNHDDLFTPTNRSGRYYGNLGNGRPIRIYSGFSDTEKIQVFVGITDGVPVIDDKAKTVRFHCIDFLRKLQETELNEEVILTDSRTDQGVSAVLQAGGLITSQFNLDTGSVVIPFIYFKKGTKVGTALRELTEAELGSLYMDENGVIRFENRTNWTTKSQVWQFTPRNTIDISTPDVGRVINLVEVFSNTRALEDHQPVFTNGGSAIKFTDDTTSIAPGESKIAFVNFKDDEGDLPVTNITNPTASTRDDSGFEANSLEDGTGADLTASVSVGSISKFSTAMKMTFTNNGSYTAVINRLEIWADPARIQNKIYVIEKDTASITEFEEQPIKIENNYIQDEAAATSIARIVLEDRAEIDDERTLIVKGVPQLQVGDFVRYVDRKGNDTYYTKRISGIISSDGLRQTVTIVKRTINEYFRIGISTIGGDDPIAP